LIERLLGEKLLCHQLFGPAQLLGQHPVGFGAPQVRLGRRTCSGHLSGGRSTSLRSTANTWPFFTMSPRSTRTLSSTPITELPRSATLSGSIRQPRVGAGAAGPAAAATQAKPSTPSSESI
jgi:hypothetical protein